MKNILKHFILIGFVLLFVACEGDKAIVHDLNERDANEILVLLSRNNIKAFKEKEERNQEIYWLIKVNPEQETLARSILVSNNLPRLRKGGLEGICKEISMVTTEQTEKCRMLLAAKGEIINSLESVPGVVSADVVLNIPEKVEFPTEDTPIERPTAAVTVKYLTDANVKTALTEEKIKEFVANSVSGLDSRDVAVIISYLAQRFNAQNSSTQGLNSDPNQQTDITQVTNEADEESVDSSENEDLVKVGGMVMDQSSATKFKVIAGLLLFILLALAGGFIFTLIRISQLKKQTPLEPDETLQLEQGDDDDQKLLEGV